MLANLFGKSSARSSQAPDSLQDDQHTKQLLFGQPQNSFTTATSPPSSPFGSPTLRSGTYDEYNGVELEDKDIRILLAQDAYGLEEKPTLLFDSRSPPDVQGSNRGTQSRIRSPPGGLRDSQASSAAATAAAEDNAFFRNRSATISGAPGQWARPVREVSTKEDALLECMFGVTGATKVVSSTKMHVIPASPQSDRLPPKSPELPGQRRRMPLSRSRTSSQFSVTSSIDSDHDTLLITRLFHVSLPEHEQVSVEVKKLPDNAQSNSTPDLNEASRSSPSKPPKLVERKVPAFAFGFVLTLPPHHHQRGSSGRPTPSSRYGQSFASASSSIGSDMQSSWTFLDAIPSSMTSSRTLNEENDHRIDMIVNNWDIILRTISFFEYVAVEAIDAELQKIIIKMDGTKTKTPKEKTMQRINQRMIAIKDNTRLKQSPALFNAALRVASRITYALRIPRVLTGLGFSAGHWTDETRTLYKCCGGQTQNFFLFNLLTAFLGNHTQWMERLAPDWYRKQYKASHRGIPEQKVLASRTIIVSQQRALARRLVYILASFLLGNAAHDGIHRRSEDAIKPPAILSSSPRQASIRLSPSMDRELSAGSSSLVPSKPNVGISTSASSTGSGVSTLNQIPKRQGFVRKDSNKFLLKDGNMVTSPDTDSLLCKTTTVGPVPSTATPLAHILSIQDSYFNRSSTENVLIEVSDSAASTDLVKVLHRASSSRHRSSSVSSTWGSLMSNISDLWGGRHSANVDPGSLTTVASSASPGPIHKRSSSSAISIVKASNPLQDMVDELDQTKSRSQHSAGSRGLSLALGRPVQTVNISTPRLHVDSTDGVVDVELDLPGFQSISEQFALKHGVSSTIGRAIPSTKDLASSTCSLRSVTAQAMQDFEVDQANVAGYLRKHHEDFALHAVRPYAELIDDIKKSMYDEPTPPEIQERIMSERSIFLWYPVCTTLVADMTNNTIRRLTLRRRYEIKSSVGTGRRPQSSSGAANASPLTLRAQEIQDELVADFDTTLANAIEKALDISPIDSTRTRPGSKPHSRSVSLDLSRENIATRPTTITSDPTNTTNSPNKQKQTPRNDHRHVIVGALEDIVKNVNDDLNSVDKPAEETTYGANSTLVNKPRTKDGRHENVLREGVKNWLLSVEHQTKVW